MTAPDLALADTDPAAFVLAVADLRERRVRQVADWSGNLPWAETKDAVPAEVWTIEWDEDQEDEPGGVVGSSRLLTVQWTDESGQGLAEHIATEANPEHALAEVALWRAVADSGLVDLRWFMPTVVAAAKAYLGGAS